VGVFWGKRWADKVFRLVKLFFLPERKVGGGGVVREGNSRTRFHDA